MSADALLDVPAQPDRRTSHDRRGFPDRRQRAEQHVPERRAKDRRQKVERRRQIDPTTCERDYTADEIEFMTAIDRYRRDSGRPFPTWSEVLEVVRALGYQKVSNPQPAPVVTAV